MIYNNLEVWKEARFLAKITYGYTAAFPKEETLGLQAQIRRAAIAIPSSIAEGCGRTNRKDLHQYFGVARGSLYELETEVYLSNDLNLINNEALESLLTQISKTKELLNSLIKYYKTDVKA